MKKPNWVWQSVGVVLIMLGATAFWGYRTMEEPASARWIALRGWSMPVGTWIFCVLFAYLREKERALSGESVVLPRYMWLLLVAFVLFIVTPIEGERLAHHTWVGINLLASVLVGVTTALVAKELSSSPSLPAGSGDGPNTS